MGDIRAEAEKHLRDSDNRFRDLDVSYLGERAMHDYSVLFKSLLSKVEAIVQSIDRCETDPDREINTVKSTGGNIYWHLRSALSTVNVMSGRSIDMPDKETVEGIIIDEGLKISTWFHYWSAYILVSARTLDDRMDERDINGVIKFIEQIEVGFQRLVDTANDQCGESNV